MAVKRRVVWFDDDDWTRMQATVSRRETTVSRFLRELALHEVTMDERETRDHAEGQAWRAARKVAGVEAPAIQPTVEPKAARPARSAQAQRDAILKKVNRARSI